MSTRSSFFYFIVKNINKNLYRRKVKIIKPITQEGLNALFAAKILKNTSRGFVTYKEDKPVGHYRTKGAAKRMYIEDWYADKAKKLTERDKNNG